MTVVLAHIDTGIQQGIGNGELPEVKEAVFFVVDVDGEEMQGIQGGDFENAQRCYRIRIMEFIRDIHYPIYRIGFAYGYAGFRHTQRFGYKMGKTGGLRAATYQHNGLRRIAVEFKNLFGNGIGQIFDIGHNRVENFGGR